MKLIWKKNLLIVALMLALVGVGTPAMAEEDEGDETSEAEAENGDDEEEQDEAAPSNFRPTFGVGLETGFFFTDLARFNDYVLVPNDAEAFDIRGTQHIDLVIESTIIENIRMSLFGGMTFAWHDDPSLFGWYVGIEPAYVAGADGWEMAVGVSAGIGGLQITTADDQRLSTSLALLRPFLEVRRHLFDGMAAYVRGGFNQWYPYNLSSDDFDLETDQGRQLSTVDLSTGGPYLAVGVRFGTLRHEEIEPEPEPEPEPECRQATVEDDCPDVPEAQCAEGVLRTYRAVCEEGECGYESTEIECATGTMCGEENGEPACVPEPDCYEDGDCDEPPSPRCEDQILTTFGGVCEEGECNYEPSQQPCPEGTMCGLEGGVPACVEEPEELVVEVDEETRRIEISDVIHFETNSDEIQAQSYPLLNQMARVLNENPQVELVRIEGHTDTDGTAEHNMDLSQRRAESIRQALIERGVAEDRLLSEGFGFTRPIADNQTPEGRAANRRVELHILDAPEPEETAEVEEVDEAEDVEVAEEAEVSEELEESEETAEAEEDPEGDDDVDP